MSTRALQIDIMLLGFRDPDTDSVLAGGVVNFFDAGTSDPATVWDEKEKTNARTSVTLDSNGQAQVYGDGIYKLEILDVNSVAVAYSPLDNIKIRAVSTNVVETNTTYTATTDDDLILGDTSGGPLTINLYPAADFISELSIKNISAAGNAITVDPDGSELIDGAATEDLSDNQAQAYFSNSSNWFGAGVSTGINFTSTSLISGTNNTFDESGGVTTINVPDASETVKGASEKATDVEVTAAVDAERYMTPDQAVLMTVLQAASATTADNVVEPTQAEQEAGVSSVVQVTPAVQQYHPSASKSWVDFLGQVGPVTNASYNVSSVTRGATGIYTVNFTVPFSSVNFSAVSVAEIQFSTTRVTNKTVGSVDVYVYDETQTGIDASVNLICMGDQ